MLYSIRFGAAVLPALVVCAALLFLMQALIAREGESVVPEAVHSIVEFVRVPKPLSLVTRRDRPKPPPPVDVPPPEPAKVLDPVPGGTRWHGPGKHTVPPAEPGEGGRFSNGSALVLVTPQPTYPRRALERSLSGWVLLRFDVNAQGLVVAPEVMDHCAWTEGADECADSPNTVFDRAAVKAVEKSHYKPKVENGVAVGVYGVMSRIAFQIQE